MKNPFILAILIILRSLYFTPSRVKNEKKKIYYLGGPVLYICNIVSFSSSLFSVNCFVVNIVIQTYVFLLKWQSNYKYIRICKCILRLKLNVIIEKMYKL